jgi:hypothetical protein
MANMQTEGFKFPDEMEDGGAVQAEVPDFEIDIEDDTPEEDRGRSPSDPEKVKQLEIEVDDLDKYSKDAKDKLIRMKRVWHDERRAKEAAERERQAAIEVLQQVYGQYNHTRQMLAKGTDEYIDAKKAAAKAILKEAKRAYKQAYETGDSARMAEAQEDMMKAQLDLEKVKAFSANSLHKENFEVQQQPQVQPQYQQPRVPRPDDRAMRWQDENSWFGQNKGMTAYALAIHDELRDDGVDIGSEEYYAKLDKTMRKRFPDRFADSNGEVEHEDRTRADMPRTRPATVVAPATRTTAPKRIRLTQSQVATIKKLNLTPEQYVRELLKLENNHG